MRGERKHTRALFFIACAINGRRTFANLSPFSSYLLRGLLSKTANDQHSHLVATAPSSIRNGRTR